MPRPKLKRSITRHTNQLLGYSIERVRAIAEGLANHQPSERDLEKRDISQIAAARFIAAKIILAAAEGNASLLQQIWDRTEGKVADLHISLDGNKVIEQLEAARQRVQALHTSLTHSQQVIEGEVITSDALELQSSATGLIETPGRPPLGEPAQVPSVGVGVVETLTPRERDRV